MEEITLNTIGETETLLATGLAGVIHGLFAVQPISILAFTGPVLLFETIIYRVSVNEGEWEEYERNVSGNNVNLIQSWIRLAVTQVLIPYSRKSWWFGGLYYNRQIKIRQNFLLAYIRMVIPYRAAKFKSANGLFPLPPPPPHTLTPNAIECSRVWSRVHPVAGDDWSVADVTAAHRQCLRALLPHPLLHEVQ